MPPARTRSTISVTALPKASAAATTTQVRLSCMAWFPSWRDASAHAVVSPAGFGALGQGLTPKHVARSVRSGWVYRERVDAPGPLAKRCAHTISAASWRRSPALLRVGQSLPLTGGRALFANVVLAEQHAQVGALLRERVD